MAQRNEICTLDTIGYFDSGSYFGFICQFTSDDGTTFSSGESYVANVDQATPFTKAYVFDKMTYCMKQTGCYNLEEIKNRRVRVVFDNGSFLGFWFIKE